jgi:hypothetical protein
MMVRLSQIGYASRDPAGFIEFAQWPDCEPDPGLWRTGRSLIGSFLRNPLITVGQYDWYGGMNRVLNPKVVVVGHYWCQ